MGGDLLGGFLCEGGERLGEEAERSTKEPVGHVASRLRLGDCSRGVWIRAWVVTYAGEELNPHGCAMGNQRGRLRRCIRSA